MLVALVSAKGAPGVTTTALCLAAGAAGLGMVVEVDPAGGDLECWTGPHGEAGLVGLAARPHSFGTRSDLDGYAVDIADGLRAVVAPTTETAMAGLVSRSIDQLGQALAASGELDVFADLGRFSGSSATTPLAAASDVVVVVCRPTLDSIEHARGLLAPGGVVDATATPAAVVVVGGDRPYGPDEIARALSVPVVGVLPWDPRAVVALVEQGLGRVWQRSALAAAAADIAAAVPTLATGVPARG